MKKRAVLSVSDKTGLIDFAAGLVKNGYEIVSTGGTAALLSGSDIPVTGIEEITGFPECLDGRVKTLHPHIFGGLLAIRENKEHMSTLERLDIDTIDLVCVNLYPFKNTVAKQGHTLEEAIENIDIGGPSLLRAGSKNHKFVTVVTDVDDYQMVLESMDKDGNVPADVRFKLAAKAFAHTAAYDAHISHYLEKAAGVSKFPEQLILNYELKQKLRYGENSHQEAAYYTEAVIDAASVTAAEVLHGKELSYNNIGDSESAVSIVKEFSAPACVAIKHATPCAVALGKDSAEAYARAFEADSASIYGGILAFNTEVNAECAENVNQTFIEIVIAPAYSEDALSTLKKKKNLRILLLPGISLEYKEAVEYRLISGGLLVQDRDRTEKEEYKTVTKTAVPQELVSDLEFAMKVCKHVKSNAIVLAKDGCTTGIGGGNVSRIWSAQAAIERAKDKAKGSVMASDAFLPFEDVVLECKKAGVSAIIQPGGSINDDRSVAACDEAGLPMIFTGIRHFRH